MIWRSGSGRTLKERHAWREGDEKKKTGRKERELDREEREREWEV